MLQKRLLHQAQIKAIHRCLCQRTNETIMVRIDLFCLSWYVVRVRSTSHPVVFPNAHHCIGAEGTSRVHAVSYYDERTVQNHPKVDTIFLTWSP